MGKTYWDLEGVDLSVKQLNLSIYLVIPIVYSEPMSTQQYSVTPHTVGNILNWVETGQIAIPEIQRPFVWSSSAVRDLLDSLYRGYPVGYLITWQNPTIRLKDGTSASGKKILIDGQQRVTALMTAIQGIQVITKDYELTKYKIAFNPQTETFEVSTPALKSSKEWLPDISEFYKSSSNLFKITKDYLEANPACDVDKVPEALKNLSAILNNQIGVIDLRSDLDIDTVTEIFIRVNNSGASLSQADFAMSKIASNENFGGNVLRKTIDYFCHLSKSPEFLSNIKVSDKSYADGPFLQKIKWAADFSDDIYDPSYTDMLRVAFTSEFGRGKIQDLVALLSGRNFETKDYEEKIVEASYASLQAGVERFINETNFKNFVMILKSAGFTSSALISGNNATNMAYIIYLHGRKNKIPANQLDGLVRQWFVMSLLTQRYSGSTESEFDRDIRQINSVGLETYFKTIINSSMSASFWSGNLPQELATTSTNSPFWNVYVASQVKSKTEGFLSAHVSVESLVGVKGDIHHIYPKNYLIKNGFSKIKYNQIANLAITESGINQSISDKSPEKYFTEILEGVSKGKAKYGEIKVKKDLEMNMEAHAIPLDVLEYELDYEDFLENRRALMANLIKDYFQRIASEA